ncbi:substrate-binding domain-containing protein [Arenibaculum pallidiluteum]|uniref:substrate-binding domain-containing protein n=1 Tax=Arenibaculum pallidiluteum TaxID=2812559 RepID=UPI001A95E233|nr:substrate-binding domain-containing protein [Arenibaculum pallidiluteum]
MARLATIRDVAARAGVSIATVSRVLNGDVPANPVTAAKVRAAAAELEFRPNRLGRGLKIARTRVLGVLIPSLSNPVFADSVGGIQAAARRAGYSVLIAATGYDAEREDAEIESLLSHRVEGLVVTVADADRSAALAKLDRSGTPYELVYNLPEATCRPAVAVDNIAAARVVVSAMIALGHRRIGMIAGRFLASDRSRQRHAGFMAALNEAGLPPGPVIEVAFDDLRLGGGFGSALTGSGRPTALFCSNDLLALAVMGALHDLGLRIPDDVSVAGFDGIGFGSLLRPSLATVVQPARAMGEAAFERLLARLDGAPPAPPLTLPFTLRHGGSLGPAPSPQP